MNELLPTILVINLKSRPDRLMHVKEQFIGSNLDFQLVEGIDGKDLPTKNPGYLSNGAFACWLSHLKALKTFVDTDFQYAIIAEDDLKIRDLNQVNKAISIGKTVGLDFLQIGFLTLNFRYHLDIAIANFENRLIKVFKIYSQGKFPFSETFKKKVRVSRAIYSDIGIIPDDIRAGAHFYLISRRMATDVLELNDPFFLSFDGFLVSLAWSRRYRMFRLRKSLVSQTNSLSSIKPWGVVSGDFKYDN